VSLLQPDYTAIPAIFPGVWKGVRKLLVEKRKTSRFKDEQRRINMLWTIFVVLLVLWLLGFSLHVAGGLIHLLLVVALVVLVINLLSGRRNAI
jgi:uncharacterized membrane protein